MVDHLTRLGIGISSFASVGNKLDVSSNDMLMWWERDGQTRVAVLYIESFGNPRKFARTARRVGARIPVITVHAGRSEAGQRAAATHTSSAATPLVTREALFEQAGIIATPSFGELMGATALLATQPPPAGRTVAIVSNVGGAGVLAADACTDLGLTVHHPHGETRQRLRALIPDGGSVSGPVDTVATVSADDFRQALEVLAADEEVHAIIALVLRTGATGDLLPAIEDADSACRWRWWCSTSRRPSGRSTPGAGRSPPTPTRRRRPGRSPAPRDTRSGAPRRTPWCPPSPDVDAERGRELVHGFLALGPTAAGCRTPMSSRCCGCTGSRWTPAAAARRRRRPCVIGVKDDQMFGPLVVLRAQRRRDRPARRPGRPARAADQRRRRHADQLDPFRAAAASSHPDAPGARTAPPPARRCATRCCGCPG